MDLRVTVQLRGPPDLAALDGLLALLGQGPVVDPLPRSGPIQGPVRALGPLLPPSQQQPLVVPTAILRPKPIALELPGGQQDMACGLPLFPS